MIESELPIELIRKGGIGTDNETNGKKKKRRKEQSHSLIEGSTEEKRERREGERIKQDAMS